jgi:hypothetical protein
MAFKDYFELRGLPEQQAAIQEALASFKAPHLSLRQVVPVEFVDLTSFSGMVERDQHFHAHDSGGDHGHGLADKVDGPLGLFWFKGLIQIEQSLSRRKSQAVFMAEAAHAVDFLSPEWTDEKRGKLFDAYHGVAEGTTGPIDIFWQGNAQSHNHGWFGPQEYYDTPGESFMIGFMLSFSEYTLTDYWSHGTTAAVIEKIRQLLEPATETLVQVISPKGKRSRKYHRQVCRFLKNKKVAPAIDILNLQPCKVCKP